MEMPSFASSPCTRGAPQRWLALLMFRISSRISGATPGRPGLRLRLFQVQYRLNPQRCQRMTVLGFTMTRTLSQSVQILRNSTQNSRSALGTVTNTNSKLLIYGLFQEGRVLAQDGVQQSPIDLTDAISAGGGGLEIQWQPAAGEVVDNGHTIQVNIDAGSSITLQGRQFSLLQFHFHLPSEHTVDGEEYPLEVHFVHQAEEGDLAVIGVFMDVGGVHSAVQSIWDAIPGVDQAPTPLVDLDPNAFLPGGRSYFRYAGSLTTPPCSEVVNWVVLTEAIAVSQAQVDAFAALYPTNARPVQPLNRPGFPGDCFS